MLNQCAVSCETDNVIYLIKCERCKQKYIGEAERQLKDRIAEHKGYVLKKTFTKYHNCLYLIMEILSFNFLA